MSFYFTKSHKTYTLTHPTSLSPTKNLLIYSLIRIAARQGLEPRLPGPEPGVLPLDDLAAILTKFFGAGPTIT